MADRKFGILSASSLKSLQAAFPDSKEGRSNRTAEVLRGEDTTAFGIHRNIIEHCSPFFKLLLNGGTPTGIRPETEIYPVSEIHLEGDAATFALYTEWVYSGRLWKKTLRDDMGDTKFLALGQAYVLGEKLLDQTFKNMVLDTILSEFISGAKIDLTLVAFVYGRTNRTAPLRQLLVDIYTWYGHKDWLEIETTKGHIPPKFLADLSNAFLERYNDDVSVKARYPVMQACKYHEHPDGNTCSNAQTMRHPRKLAAGSEPGTDKVTS
ncbi:hypothetical protein D6C77_05730 [Aureobasidium pullulans]|nr:hypothetical protein D6C77_05730 [Aureobasidium pullulans]